VQVIEAASGKEVLRTKFEATVNSVAFSPDSRWLAAGSSDYTVRVVDTQWFEAMDGSFDDSSKHLAQFLAGIVFEPKGALRPLIPEEWNTIARALREREPSESNSNQQKVFQWHITQPERRMVSPWINRHLWEKVGNDLISSPSARWIEDLADTAPWHPLVPVSLARNEKNMVRKSFLAKLTLKRLADADESLYGTVTLANYAAHAAEWMLEMGLEEEAIATGDFALKKQPDHPLAKETKTKIEEALKK
jgi:hypothetical protein